MKETSGHRENGGYEVYFHKGITWSYSTMAAFSCRVMPTGFVFDVNGSSIFMPEESFKALSEKTLKNLRGIIMGIRQLEEMLWED